MGFRPFVYKMAQDFKVTGWVCNASDGVHIRFSANPSQAKDFYQSCLKEKPQLSVITSSDMIEVANEDFSEFQIKDSLNARLDLSITPDFAICPNCLEELHDNSNRRKDYPFITCTQCGPRYSILKELPYDRPLTAMSSYTMCPDCNEEYHDPLDGRYYSQTNSCDACGVQLSFSDESGVISNNQAASEVISMAVQKLKEQSIVAVKGIGGFLLLCDAQSDETIRRLRARKQRPKKPFAILYPSIEEVRKGFSMSEEEKNLLMGAASPIVLLEPNAHHDIPIEEVAPGLDRLGVMIPYAPILALIAREFGKPLIATSANVSGTPIVHGDDESRLLELADYVLSNDRPIHYPQDDSVVQFTVLNKRSIILRRSRGLAPSVFTTIPNHRPDTLALGAEMKGAFALSQSANTYVSQYLGNLGSYENQLQFQDVLGNFTRLVKADVQQIVVDQHPGYFCTQLGESMAAKNQMKLSKVQHHEAHFAAVLAENKLTEENGILGVIWDGTGQGNDGNIWGGEFFDYTNHEIKRIAHLRYSANLANDRMAVDNRLAALSFSGPTFCQYLEEAFDLQEWEFYTKSVLQPSLQSSSMGRLFDAIAFLSGISEKNSYEGQAAILLEQEARRFLSKSSQVAPYPFLFEGGQISLEPAKSEIFGDRDRGFEGIAARFHFTLVDVIRSVAEKGDYQKIAFSGGVFQNSLLVDLILTGLGKDFQLHFHRELSPNDENIAFGQLAHVHYIKNKENINLKTLEQCA